MPYYETQLSRIRLRNTLERMIQQLLKRELRKMGAKLVYVMLDTDTRRDLSGVEGMTSRGMTVDFRAELGERWQGPGPCIFLSLSGMTRKPGVFRRAVAVAIHEVAHVFQWRIVNGFYSGAEF